LPAAFLQNPLHGREQIQNEVKSIGYLLRLWCAEFGAIGIKTASISRDRHNFPDADEAILRNCLTAIRKKVDHTMEIQVAQDGSIRTLLAPGPIIDAEVVNREKTGRRLGFSSNPA
jgi:hypothetical protein